MIEKNKDEYLKTLPIRISKEMWKKLRNESTSRETSMNSIITELLKKHFDSNKSVDDSMM